MEKGIKIFEESSLQPCNRNFIDVYDTVLQMRYQRRRMVQKQEQYLYVYRCLRDEVKTEEGGYYEG